MNRKNSTIINFKSHSRFFNTLGLSSLLILALLSLIFISSPVKAEFSAYTNNEITLCSCDKEITNIYVSNTGFSTEYYHLQLSPDFVDAAPKNFILRPGETQQIPVIINPLCGTIGKYALEVTITSSSEQKILKQEMNILNCKDFDVQINSPPFSVCGNLQQNITIFNKEIVSENGKKESREFLITGKGMDSRTVNLYPRESSTVALNPSLDCASKSKAGEYITEYNVSNGFLKKTIKLRNIIYPQYKAYELEINPNYFNIAYDDKRIYVTVKNIGKFYGSYSLSSTFTDYNNTQVQIAELEPETVSLSPGEKKKIPIALK